jgi:hypothetical protein
MSVLQFKTSDYPFGIFKLLAIVLYVLLQFMTSDDSFGIFKHLAIVLSVLQSKTEDSKGVIRSLKGIQQAVRIEFFCLY